MGRGDYGFAFVPRVLWDDRKAPMTDVTTLNPHRRHLQAEGRLTVEPDGSIQQWRPYLADPCGSCGTTMRYDSDYFVIRDHLWRKACRSQSVPRDSLMCITCTEGGLGRLLRQRDFKPCLVTDGYFGFDKTRFEP